MRKRFLWIVIGLVSLGIAFSCWGVLNKLPEEKIIAPEKEYERVPLEFIRSHEGYFLLLSGEPFLLEFRFGEKERDWFTYFYDENIFEVKGEESEGVKIQHREHRGKEGIDTYVYLQRKKPNGWVRFLVVPKLYREKFDINRLTIHQDYDQPLSDYLKDEEKLEINSPEVKEAAAQIRQSLKLFQRDNPYYLIKATLAWLNDNITYSLVPKYLIDAFTEVIKNIPKEERNDARLLLEFRNAIPKIFPEVFKRIDNDEDFNFLIETYYLYYYNPKEHPWGMDPYELSFKFLNKLSRCHSFNQRAFWSEYEISAKNTLKDRLAKCTGLARTFVAICRSFGIPAKKAGGYAGSNPTIEGLHHSWAIVYLFPHGWIEVDPTYGDFDDFPYNQYAYKIVWLFEKDNVEVSACKLVNPNTDN